MGVEYISHVWNTSFKNNVATGFFPNRAPGGCIRFGDFGDFKCGPSTEMSTKHRLPNSAHGGTEPE